MPPRRLSLGRFNDNYEGPTQQTDAPQPRFSICLYGDTNGVCNPAPGDKSASGSNPCSGGLVPSARVHEGLDGVQCVEKEDDCAPNWGAITIRGGETVCRPNSQLYGSSGNGGSGGSGGGGGGPLVYTPEQLAQMGFITDTAKMIAGQGKALFDVGMPAYKTSTEYYQALLGGDKAAAARAAGPAMEGIAESFTGAGKALEASGLRGGALDAAKADLIRSEAGQVGGLIAGQQPAAASALLSGGLAGTQLGVGSEGTGAQLSSSLFGMDVSAMLQNKGLNIQDQLGNRGLDIQSQLGNRGLDIQQMLGLKGLDLQQQQLTFQQGPAFQLQEQYLSAYLSQLGNQAQAAKGAKNGALGGDMIKGAAVVAAALI